MTSILLVDDHPLMREVVRSKLEAHGACEIVGEEADGRQALHRARQLEPDLVILDIGLPGMNGLEVARVLLQEKLGVQILILTMYDEDAFVQQALEMGVRGYVLKSAPAAELVQALEAVFRGEIFVSAELSRNLLREYAQRERERPVLTPREHQVLALIAEGYRNKEIARELCLSVRTIETYRRRIMDKLDIHTAVGLTRYAIAEGIVSAG